MTSDVRFRGKADWLIAARMSAFAPSATWDRMELLPCNLTPQPPFADGKSLL
jgi:hypothetical protein